MSQPTLRTPAGSMARMTRAMLRHLVLILVMIFWSIGGAWAAGQSETTRYTCPMHPHYIADQMGACPICGMDLVAMTSESSAPGGSKGDGASARTGITIAPEMIQNIGIRLGSAEMTLFGRQIRAYGLVQESSRLESIISGRVAGWVEKLKVTAIGDRVMRGDRLFSLYSPDLIAAQRDYLEALRQNNRNRLDAARRRLTSLGLQSRALAILEKERKIQERVPFFAEHAGVVAQLAIRSGSYVKPGMTLLRIQDYSRVWLMASVPEKDLGFLRPGTPARISFPNLPSGAITSKVNYIYPTIDAGTRTAQVRLVLENPHGLLRPGSYADVLFEVDANQRLAIPDEAILMDRSGVHVLVSLGQGRFAPRAVRTGLSSGGRTEILKGLEEGERIVLSGQFLLDSESALRESFAKMQRIQGDLSLIDLSPNQMAMVDHMVDAALYIHEALVDGFDVDPKALGPALEIKDHLWNRYGETRLGTVLNNAAAAIKAAQLARSERELFQALNRLSDALAPWILKGHPEHYRTRGVVLFMEEKSGGSIGRLWIQTGDEILNPYGDAPGHPFSGHDPQAAP